MDRMEPVRPNEGQEEAITAAALRYDGRKFTGRNHGEAFEELEKALKDTKITKKIEEGFVTTKDRFVDRGEAYQIAKKHQQLKEGKDKDEWDALDSNNVKKYEPQDGTLH